MYIHPIYIYLQHYLSIYEKAPKKPNVILYQIYEFLVCFMSNHDKEHI